MGEFKLVTFDWADDGTTLCEFPEEARYESLEAAAPVAENADKWGVVLALAWSVNVPDQIYKWVRNVGWCQVG